MKDMEMSIIMRCSVCGNDQFTDVDESIEDLTDAPDEIKVKCSDCGRIITKEQLIEENSEIIEANVEDYKDEIIKRFEKDLNKLFK